MVQEIMGVMLLDSLQQNKATAIGFTPKEVIGFELSPK
jgi:hypothetical protein